MGVQSWRSCLKLARGAYLDLRSTARFYVFAGERSGWTEVPNSVKIGNKRFDGGGYRMATDEGAAVTVW